MPVEIIILSVLGIMGLMRIIASPYFGLVLFTALLYLRPMDLFPVLRPFHIVFMVGGLTFVSLLLKKKDDKKPIFKKCAQLRLLNLLILIMIISVITSIWRSNSLGQFINFLKLYIAFLLITKLVDSPRKLKGVIWTMVLSGLIIGITSILNYFKGVDLAVGHRARAIIGGMFSNPNDLALCFIMLIPFICYLFVNSRPIFKKIFIGGCLIISLLTIIFTYSRGGFLGLAGVLFFLFLRSKSKIKAVIGVSLIVFLFLSFAPTNYIERMKAMPGYQEDSSAVGRIAAWRAGGSMMRNHLFGVGLGNFKEGFVMYRPEGIIAPAGLRIVAHNAFIQVGGELGFFGLIVFMLLIIVSLKDLNRVKYVLIKSKDKQSKEIAQLADVVFISLCGFIICALFLSQAYNWIFYYLIGFSVVLKELRIKYAKNS